MTEKKCPYCFTVMDLRASVCPSCKKKTGSAGRDGVAQKHYSLGSVCCVSMTALFVVIIIAAATKNNYSPQKESDPYSAARGACMMAIKEVLYDPGSANFSAGSSWYVEKQKDGTIRVQPQLRSKNAFGAYINSTWNCVAKPEGANIKVLSLKQIP